MTVVSGLKVIVDSIVVTVTTTVSIILACEITYSIAKIVNEWVFAHEPIQSDFFNADLVELPVL